MKLLAKLQKTIVGSWMGLPILVSMLLPRITYANPDSWQREWSDTDFSKHSVEFQEIMSGGSPKDGISSINKPEFEDISEIDNIAGTEPVISISINGDSRAYPIRILMYHEIVGDVMVQRKNKTGLQDIVL